MICARAQASFGDRFIVASEIKIAILLPMIIKDLPDRKEFRSTDYNAIFMKETGWFARWGKTKEADPDMAPAPEILDIEVTTICNGVSGLNSDGSAGPEAPCRFCYKSNTKNGKNMSLDTFKTVLDKMVKTGFLMQVAFGADAHAESNPSLIEMMKYCRAQGVVPNITVADISDEMADKLVGLVGAVAVSRYANKNICYDSVKRLTDRGLKQTNIHVMSSLETHSQVVETIQDRISDPRLSKLNAIVLLSLKRKGRGESFHQLPQEDFAKIVRMAMELNIGLGFDSCSASRFLCSVRDDPKFKTFQMLCEPCESSLFSSFINVDAKFFPCSFAEKSLWEEGLDVANCEDFVKDIWMNPKTVEFRKHLLSTVDSSTMKCRECPIFEV